MLGIKYFGHLEHYCFEKNDMSDFFGRSATSPMTSYILGADCKIWKWRHNSLFLTFRSFSVPIFCLFGIF